jgi:hypothetical protein
MEIASAFRLSSLRDEPGIEVARCPPASLSAGGGAPIGDTPYKSTLPSPAMMAKSHRAHYLID